MPSETVTTNDHESAWPRLEIRGRRSGIDITAAEREAESVRRRRARRVAYIGVAAAVAHAALKLAWALGSTIGVEDEPVWEQSLTTELEIALWATAALAAIAAGSCSLSSNRGVASCRAGSCAAGVAGLRGHDRRRSLRSHHEHRIPGRRLGHGPRRPPHDHVRLRLRRISPTRTWVRRDGLADARLRPRIERVFLEVRHPGRDSLGNAVLSSCLHHSGGAKVSTFRSLSSGGRVLRRDENPA